MRIIMFGSAARGEMRVDNDVVEPRVAIMI